MKYPNAPRPPRIYAALLALIALPLAGGGAWLSALGGSPYYLVAGAVLATSAALLWNGRREGMWLYAALFTATLLWSIGEVGFHGWALMPRLVAWIVVGGWLLLPQVRRRLQARSDAPPVVTRAASWPGFAVALAAAVTVGGGLYVVQSRPADPRYQAGVAAFPKTAILAADSFGGEWPEWGRDKAGTRFSSLSQITPENVGRLEVAWSVPITLSPGARTKGVEATPLMIGGTLYTCNGMNEVFAIDAETGQRRWLAATSGDKGETCRGVAFYRAPNVTGPCADRILAATGVATLVAFDAATGRPCRRISAARAWSTSSMG